MKEKKSTGTMQESIKGESAKKEAQKQERKLKLFPLIPINYCFL